MWCCVRGYAAILLAPINFVIYLLGLLTLMVAILKVVLGPAGFMSIRHKSFAFVNTAIMKGTSLRKGMKKIRGKVLEGMKNVKSSDPALQKEGIIRILEVGAGGGENLEFYPAGARLVCVDPNTAFEAYFRRDCAESAAHLHPDIKFVAERGEDMVSVKDESVDVVVMTLVMCSVDEVSRLVREIRRVLVPGGRLYFMEHVMDKAGTWRHTIQRALSDSGLWPSLFVGCKLTKQSAQILESAGFSHVDYTHEYLNMNTGQLQSEYVPINGPLAVANPFLYGVATK